MLHIKRKKNWIVDAIGKIASLSKEDISPESTAYRFVCGIIENK